MAIVKLWNGYFYVIICVYCLQLLCFFLLFSIVPTKSIEYIIQRNYFFLFNTALYLNRCCCPSEINANLIRNYAKKKLFRETPTMNKYNDDQMKWCLCLHVSPSLLIFQRTQLSIRYIKITHKSGSQWKSKNKNKNKACTTHTFNTIYGWNGSEYSVFFPLVEILRNVFIVYVVSVCMCISGDL